MLLETENLGNYTNSLDARSVYEIPVVGDEANNNNHNNNNNDIRRNLDENGFTIVRGTPLQDFYDGQSIFITGGTGFLGKLLIEKLLRSCPNISTIYLLIRKKKNKNMEDRIEDLMNNPVWDRLRDESPKFRHKIVGISGDCSIPGLGLSATDRERLVREVSIVFHSAATVRFDEKMDIALAINVRSTIDMIDLCKDMTKLKAFIHVSTAYANSHVDVINEKFYPHTMVYEDLEKSLRGLEDKEIERITPKIIGKWPNTYTFTKALAESIIKERSKGLNIGIVRPGIVTSSVYEPVPGWIDNFYGPTGAVTAAASGLVRSIQFNKTSRANVVPVDFTVNALIASAWDVANQTERRGDNMLIYNYISTADYSISWDEYCRVNMIYAKKYPFKDSKWAMGLTIHNSKVKAMIGRLFLHFVPALFVDFYFICTGQKPRLVKTYKKIHKFMDAITWFCTNDLEFTHENVVSMWQRLDKKDQKIFPFNIKELDWDGYFQNYMKGIRIYLLKDDLSSLEYAKKRAERLNWMHQILKTLVYLIFFWILWKIFSAVFF